MRYELNICSHVPMKRIIFKFVFCIYNKQDMICANTLSYATQTNRETLNILSTWTQYQ